MDEGRATPVLRNSSGKKHLLKDQDSSHQLLQCLTFLPLVIAQAAAFNNQKKTNMVAIFGFSTGKSKMRSIY